MIYKKIRKCLENEELLSNKDLKEYVLKRIFESECDDYVKKITISDVDSNHFNTKDKEITINPNAMLENESYILKDLISEEERLTLFINDYNVQNICNIISINHEVRHAYQHISYLNDSENSFYKSLLLLGNILTYIDRKNFNDYFYKHHHNIFFNEYDAYIYSFLETLYLLNSYDLPNLKDNIIKLNIQIARAMVSFYTSEKNSISSYLSQFIKLKNDIIERCKKENINIDQYIEMMNQYKNFELPKYDIDKIKLGLYLSDEVMNHIIDISTGKKKTLNMFEDIRCK